MAKLSHVAVQNFAPVHGMTNVGYMMARTCCVHPELHLACCCCYCTQHMTAAGHIQVIVATANRVAICSSA
jgi:hypothetical protein